MPKTRKWKAWAVVKNRRISHTTKDSLTLCIYGRRADAKAMVWYSGEEVIPVTVTERAAPKRGKVKR